MTSRSSRRNQKNLEISKIDKCQNEEDSPEKKEPDVGRRRSLRHSPGSSLSPPRKTRKTNENSHSFGENKPTTGRSPPKNSQSNKLDLDDSKCDLNSKVLSSPIKRNTRNSKQISPMSKSTFNSILPDSTSNDQNDPDENKSLSAFDQEATTSKKCTDRLTDIISKSENSSSIENVNFKDAKELALNTVYEVESNPKCASTLNEQGCKRSLSISPDISIDHINSKPRQKKKKCSDSPEKLLIETNGNDANINNDGLISSSVLVNCSKLSSLTINHTDSLPSDSIKNGEMPLVKCSELSVTDKVPIKRRLSNSPDPDINNKKSRIDHNLPSASDISDDKIVEKLSFVTISNAELPLNKLREETETSKNLLTLLNGFSLTDEQCQEICKIVPKSLKECTHVEILEALVKKLLAEATSIFSMSSPRFNKFLRQLLNTYCCSDTTMEKKHALCESALFWSKERKSMNLRHELELALMTLYCNTKCYRKAEVTANALYKETKKLQDKEKTVKACLCLSIAYHAMGNISKARANITTAKTEALKMYTPPNLQADLDLQSGIMQVAEGKDMETAFSYFKEAATGFVDKKSRSRSLKYMLLTKLLVNRPEEGEKAVRVQTHVDDIDVGVEAMLCIAKAAMVCSLSDFKKARNKYISELEDDLVVRAVLDQLYSKMLEKNLLSIISPYDRLQISVVADRIGLPRDEVERRLSQMILDGQITAQLDHRDHCLYVYRPEDGDEVFKHSLSSVTQFDKTLSLLSKRIKKLL